MQNKQIQITLDVDNNALFSHGWNQTRTQHAKASLRVFIAECRYFLQQIERKKLPNFKRKESRDYLEQKYLDLLKLPRDLLAGSQLEAAHQLARQLFKGLSIGAGSTSKHY